MPNLNEQEMSPGVEAFKKVARRKLAERGVPEDQLDAKILELMQKGVKLNINELMVEKIVEELVSQSPAEIAWRRIARKILVDRGYPEEQIEAKIIELMKKGLNLRIDVEEIMGNK
jgi:SOS response regulatory protein OraA/RecX